jgi:hypothetical protein
MLINGGRIRPPRVWQKHGGCFLILPLVFKICLRFSHSLANLCFMRMSSHLTRKQLTLIFK